MIQSLPVTPRVRFFASLEDVKKAEQIVREDGYDVRRRPMDDGRYLLEVINPETGRLVRWVS